MTIPDPVQDLLSTATSLAERDNAAWLATADVHKPKIALVTCCDARIQPDEVLGSQPGEVFTIRCLGNHVPFGGNGGERAALEYAIHHLGVRDIVVLGHAKCGAMGAVATQGADVLGGCLSELADLLNTVPREASEEDTVYIDRLARANVKFQAQRLFSLGIDIDAPDELRVHGLFIDLGKANVEHCCQH